MIKYHNLKLIGLVTILAVSLILTGISLVEAQSQAKGKPPGTGKPPKCNYNGICENDEYLSNRSPEDQTCPDCFPKSYPSLTIDQEGLQIACTGRDFPYSSGKVYQYKFENEAFSDAWASDNIGIKIRNTSIGDVDNDGSKEITAVVSYYVREERSGKGKNRVVTRYYDSKIFIFETGSSGPPSWQSPYLGESIGYAQDTIIADIDNNGTADYPDNELIIKKGKHVEIYEWIGDGFQFVWSTPKYDYTIFTIDVGDADNDGDNELVLAMFDIGAPIIWKKEGESWISKTAELIPPEFWNPNLGRDFLGIDYAKVRDADNVLDDSGQPDNEIIGGGNNNRLMVWKYNKVTDEYDSVFISEDLGGFNHGIDAGDINGDGQNEVIIGADQARTIYVFEYSNGSYNQVNSTTFEYGLSDVVVGDINYDDRDEIVIASGGIRIFEFKGSDLGSGYLEQVYNNPYGSYLEIK